MDDRIKQLIADLDRETNDIANRIDALVNSGADNDAIVAGLGPISARLRTLGQNPAEPIPPATT